MIGRVVLFSSLLVAAACSTPAESTGTTTSTSTTSTETTTTITTVATTPTTETACVERDGVLMDSRGFVCPPYLALGEANDPTLGYRAGTYTTRFTEPTFTFTRDTNFWARGERIYVVGIDELASAVTFALASDVSKEYRSYPFETHDWVRDLSTTQVEYWGYPGTQIDFTIGTCPQNGNGCVIHLETVTLWAWGWSEDEKARLLFIDVPGGPIGFEIGAPASLFDQYWTEVAEPILTSVEFLDQ